MASFNLNRNEIEIVKELLMDKDDMEGLWENEVEFLDRIENYLETEDEDEGEEE